MLTYHLQSTSGIGKICPIGGTTRQIVGCARWGAFGCAPQGVYFVPCGPSDNPPVDVVDWEMGRTRQLEHWTISATLRSV
jgi:hypothetical protein